MKGLTFFVGFMDADGNPGAWEKHSSWERLCESVNAHRSAGHKIVLIRTKMKKGEDRKREQSRNEA